MRKLTAVSEISCPVVEYCARSSDVTRWKGTPETMGAATWDQFIIIIIPFTCCSSLARWPSPKCVFLLSLMAVVLHTH